jgi:hypothetical protein
MTLSIVLLAPEDLLIWIEVGASMIAIDTLVHNWLKPPEAPSPKAGRVSTRNTRPSPRRLDRQPPPSGR